MHDWAFTDHAPPGTGEATLVLMVLMLQNFILLINEPPLTELCSYVDFTVPCFSNLVSVHITPYITSYPFH